ncbi:MAG: LacI family DNA-binding transcriptional regulator [Catenulispora sp.]|nr:LacI family DNA-binding transcriptional regulator [Catenulispora sp.]
MTGKDGGAPKPGARPAPETASAPTLETVAAEAGVSRATVSRVVNGSPKVSEDVRAAVEAAVARLGYVPNRAARSLVTRRTGSVALVVSEAEMKVFTDPLLAAMVRSLGVALSVRDVQLVLMMVRADHERKRLTGYLLGGHVDGVFLMSLHEGDPLPRILYDSGLPVVQMARPLGDVKLPYVDVDNVHGARLAVRHLVAIGRHRIATIAGPRDMVAGVDRLDGFRQELIAARMADHRVAFGDFSQSSGEQAMLALLADHPDLDAVFCASDLMAAGALRALRRHERRVPEDVAVVGYDDLDVALLTEPPLSSVSQPVEAMAATMVDMLLSRIAGRPKPSPAILPTRLVLRASG